MKKIYTWEEVQALRDKWRSDGEKLVFTNGCFDILHAGHVTLLERARALGDRLLVALNSDSSISRIKGPDRPVRRQSERAEIMGGVRFVDAVVIFEQDTPLKLIEYIEPDVLVKGGDWQVGNIVGADVVLRNNGRVEVIPLEEGRSTTGILERIGAVARSDTTERGDKA